MTTPMPPDISQPPGPAELAQWLQADAVLMRDACARVAARWSYVRSLGQEHVGASMFTMFNYLATPAEIYFGRAAQPEQWNFDDALGPARRGL